jgi:cytochrome c-type biogenesis protein CcmE
MIEDGLQAAMDAARAQVPIGVVAAWALAGVIAAGVLFATMRRRSFDAKVGGSLLVLGAVAGALLWAALQPAAECYKHVDEVVADAQRFRLRRMHLQVHGCVVPGSIERRTGTDEYRFRMKSTDGRPPAEIRVSYTGLVPDMFRSGAELVAKGTLVGDGWLDVVPDGIMTRCPSKYYPAALPDWACAP